MIHHGRRSRCTLAQAKIAIAVPVIGAALRRTLVPSTCGSLLRTTGRLSARLPAVGLAKEAGPADDLDAATRLLAEPPNDLAANHLEEAAEKILAPCGCTEVCSTPGTTIL